MAIRWFWQRDREAAKAEIDEARAEKEQARRRLHEVSKDDPALDMLTRRMQKQGQENSFARDIRRALGGAK